MTRSSAFRRRMILASAGSGKTFTLSTELIALLAADQPAGQIFASTFTRKAAGEILDRLLVRLAKAAMDDKAAAELAAFIHRPEFRRENFRGLLTQLASQLHRLNICTLDSFFIRAAGAMSLELGLPPGWTIVEEIEQRQMQADAVTAMLDAALDDPQVIVELLRLLDQGQSGRSVHQQLMRLVGDLHTLYRQSLGNAENPWTLIDAPSPPPEVSTPDLLASLADISPPLNKNGQLSANWVKALQGIRIAVESCDWKSLIDITLMQRILTGEDSFDRRQIPGGIRDVLRPLADHAKAALLRDLVRQGRAMHRLLELYDQHLTAIQRNRHGYRFDDVTSALGHVGLAEHTSDLFFRLDGRVRHLLLDEFQDTSMAQWQALEPMVGDLLADATGDRASLIVADPKQSIYGWRGGEPALVRRVGKQYALEQQHLHVSWRSSPVILDTVNRLFTNIADNKVLARHQSAAASWAEAFVPHEPAPQHRNLLGCVRLLVGPTGESPKIRQILALRQAAKLAADLHRQAPARTIGILVRTNAAVGRLMYELRGLGIEASGEGGNPLTDSPAVVGLLMLLQLIDHPADRLARYHVANSPVGSEMGFTDFRNDRAAAALARSLRRQLLIDGYGQTLHHWVTRLARSADARDLHRLEQLVELGCQFDQRYTGLRTSDFIEQVRTQRVQSPSQAAVCVMTYHQAKGLEFDGVILPQLDGPMIRGGALARVLTNRDENGRVTAIFPYLDSSLRAMFPVFDPMYEQLTRRILHDALSAMYVAVTRARQGLWMIVQPDGKQGQGGAMSMANIIRSALASDVAAESLTVLYHDAADDWWPQQSQPADQTLSDKPLMALALPRPASRRLLVRTSPSQLEAGTRVALAHELRLERTGAHYGTRLHETVEKLGWSDSPDADQQALEVIGNTPNVRAALARSRWQETDVSVLREHPFVIRDGRTILSGTFDRLVRMPGRIVIQDYKTDKDLVESIVTRYKPQMQAYRRAAAKLYDIPVDRVDVELLLLHHDTVVSVGLD